MGKGSLEADDGNGEPLALRTDGERFTSLLGGSAGGVLSGNIGVVEPEYEKATEPLDCEMAAEPGREGGVRLESRDADMLLDKRRSQVEGRA